MATLTLSQVRWIAYLLLIASAFLVGLSLLLFRKARLAPYYILRRNALRRASRRAGVAAVLFVLGILVLILAPHLTSVAIPAPTPTPTPTGAPVVTPTPRLTRTPTATPTRRPTATPPQIPTSTPVVPPPDTVLTPLPSAVPAEAGARIEVRAVALERDDNGQPVDPGHEFPPGDHRVYLFFTWEGMQDGNMTTFAWYKDGELIEFCSDTWPWGMVEGREWGERGRTSYYCRLPGGWQPGFYEIHVFIEDRSQGVAQFVITE